MDSETAANLVRAIVRDSLVHGAAEHFAAVLWVFSLVYVYLREDRR